MCQFEFHCSKLLQRTVSKLQGGFMGYITKLKKFIFLNKRKYLRIRSEGKIIVDSDWIAVNFFCWFGMFIYYEKLWKIFISIKKTSTFHLSAFHGIYKSKQIQKIQLYTGTGRKIWLTILQIFNYLATLPSKREAITETLHAIL